MLKDIIGDTKLLGITFGILGVEFSGVSYPAYAQFDNFIAYETTPGAPTFSNPFPPNPQPPVASASTIVSVDVEDEDGIDIESILR